MFPPKTRVADQFGGAGMTKDGYYVVLFFKDGPEGDAFQVAVSREQADAIVSSLCVLPQRIDTGDGLATAMTYPYRDVTVSEAVGGDLVVRMGFLEKSNIHVRLPRDSAKELARLLLQAAE